MAGDDPGGLAEELERETGKPERQADELEPAIREAGDCRPKRADPRAAEAPPPENEQEDDWDEGAGEDEDDELDDLEGWDETDEDEEEDEDWGLGDEDE